MKILPTLSEIIKKKAERKKKLQTSLDSLINQLKNIGALKIILFGSLVKEEIDVNSDLDLLVIMPSKMTGKEWMNFIYKKIERGIASDIIVYNLEEFNKKISTSSFLSNTVNTGRIVYEKAQ